MVTPTPVDGNVAGLDGDDDVVAFSDEARRAAPHTLANFARSNLILTQDDLAALPKVRNGLLEAWEAAIRMVEVDEWDNKVEEVGNPKPQATKRVTVEADYFVRGPPPRGGGGSASWPARVNQPASHLTSHLANHHCSVHACLP